MQVIITYGALGDTTQSITVNQSGTYGVTVGDGSVSAVSNDYSLSFDGASNLMTLPSTPSFNNMNDFTIMFWMNSLNDGVSREEIISKDTDPQPTGDWSCNIENHKVKFEIRHGNGPTYYASTNTNIIDSTWYFITITRNSTSGQIDMYVNGQFDIGFSGSLGTVSNVQNIYVGRHAVLNSLFYNGFLENLSIWNTTLSQQEIQNYMNCPPTGNEAGLVGYWNFEEGSGNTVYDQSPNGNNGTINGATYSTNVPTQNCQSGCSNTDSVVVNIMNVDIAQNDTTICFGNSVSLGVSGIAQTSTVSWTETYIEDFEDGQAQGWTINDGSAGSQGVATVNGNKVWQMTSDWHNFRRVIPGYPTPVGLAKQRILYAAIDVRHATFTDLDEI